MLSQPPFKCPFGILMLPTCICNSCFKSYKLLAIVRFRPATCCVKLQYFPNILFCSVFCLSCLYSMLKSHHGVSECPWSKEGEKKEKGCYALHYWWLSSYVQSQTCILLKLTPKKKIHLPFTAFPVIISCLCSLIVSVSYILVFFKRLNTRGTFISLWFPFIILYFSLLGRIQAGNT